MAYILTTEQIVEAKKLFEACDAAPDAHSGLVALGNFLDWCREYFPQLIDRALESTMAHQLADIDQILGELERDLKRQPGEAPSRRLHEHVAMLRAAVEGDDYRAKPGQ